jgi:hypothetical protein
MTSNTMAANMIPLSRGVRGVSSHDEDAVPFDARAFAMTPLLRGVRGVSSIDPRTEATTP